MMDAASSALKSAGVPPIEITDDTPATDLELIIDGKKRKLRLPY